MMDENASSCLPGWPELLSIIDQNVVVPYARERETERGKKGRIWRDGDRERGAGVGGERSGQGGFR